MSTSRAYHSPVRQQQAEETRQRIATAARTLMAAHGFDGTTIEAIAREAGVAPQTVYAVFGSKKGIVAELIDRARFGPAYRQAVRMVKSSDDPVEALRGAARIAGGIYHSEQAELDVLRGAGTVSPELAVMAREKERDRYQAQALLGEILAKSKRLRPGITVAMARDVIWTLSGRETYRMLVTERGWSLAQYENWLGDLLVRSLLTDASLKARRR
jgi:AcrR family transcriptional regulator